MRESKQGIDPARLIADNTSPMPPVDAALNGLRIPALPGSDAHARGVGPGHAPWGRRGTASLLSLVVMAVLLWLAVQPLFRPVAQPANADPRRLTVTLLPLPPLPAIAPPPVRVAPTEVATTAGGRHPRHGLHPRPTPARARRVDAPVPVVAAPVPPAPDHPVSAIANAPAASAPDPARGGEDLAAGQGSGAGRGNGTGRGDGDGDGSGATLVLSKANWVWKPSDDALQRFMPAQAVAEHRSGEAVIACRVQLTRHVHDCRVLAESAAGLGYGTAAIAASRIFRVYPPRRNGKPVDDAWVGIPVVWIVKPPPKATGPGGKPRAQAPAPPAIPAR